MGTYKVEYRKEAIITYFGTIEISEDELEEFKNSDDWYEDYTEEELVEAWLNENEGIDVEIEDEEIDPSWGNGIYEVNNIEIL